MSVKRVIVDCDGDLNDIQALIILLSAHKHQKIQIEAITCVNGSMVIQNVVKNVFRTLYVCLEENIPVYQGASTPLLCTEYESMEKMAKSEFNDTFALETEHAILDTSPLKKKHAVCAIYDIISEYPGEISVLCLGPLTNIALSIKMYPDFVNYVKELYIAGGNLPTSADAKISREFVFYMDPESAYIVFSHSINPIWLLPWQISLKADITHEWRRVELGRMQRYCIYFLNCIEYICRKTTVEDSTIYSIYEQLLAAIFLMPEIATNVVPYYAEVELTEISKRGLVKYSTSREAPNVHLIEDFDSNKLKKLLLDSIAAL